MQEAPRVTATHPRVLAALGGSADPELRRVAVAAGNVVDPEIPVLTLADLGVLRRVYRPVEPDGKIVVALTPTYSGCPATATMAADVVRAAADLRSAVAVEFVLVPAWTTDDMSEQAGAALREFGIAPPGARPDPAGPIPLSLSVRCPHCDSRDTRRTSRFGSTSCKAMWACQQCSEPFEEFKVL
ncbi:1,2-phenylacetyl-CoA epoxidase subunit PaaD [Nakamurella aerolata]|uniref:Phenylacetate-CoA oxygenase subunit PaaJ n=1 Tax=Nakamurella aerolata TaxID=1656892 RepID=A0A849AD26_9ACTN|nr:1,2-phenylacetyl-CoA epoxidase subunit PaaD [Nakamurella aerolata]NNG37101.1 phenylacetate-CoA oxygenase subunit PaaJ [Nakamurella aerolata]